MSITDQRIPVPLVSQPAPIPDTTDLDPLPPAELLRLLIEAAPEIPFNLIVEAELTAFDETQQEQLLPLLWDYIVRNRNTNDRDTLIVVASAIRKYIATMPMHRMGELNILLEPGQRSPLPIELELEIAKMIYRNYEAIPSMMPDPQPLLAGRLWKMAQAYLDPQMVLRNKFATVGTLSVEALVAMRSELAEKAWVIAVDSPYKWVGDIVADNLATLERRWTGRSAESVAWLAALRVRVLARAQYAKP